MIEKRRKSLFSKDKKYHNLLKTLIPLTSWIHIFGHFFPSQTLNCHIFETVKDFDLIYLIILLWRTTRSKIDGTTQSKLVIGALESFKRNLWVLIVKKVVLSNQNSQVFHRSAATELSKIAGSPNLSL